MMARLLISIGAGLAAAIFFIVPMKGAMAAGVTMLFAPLPLMVAGLAFAPGSAIIGTAAGAALIALVIHEYYAIFFVAWAGLPAWWLTRLAWLAQPAAPGQSGDADGLVWYPVGGLAFWAALMGAGVAGALVLIGAAYFGGYEAFTGQMSKSLTAMLESAFKSSSGPRLPEGMTPQDVARYATLAMPPVLGAWAALSYAVNLWIAGRVTQISQGMKRPWLDIPVHLRLPASATLMMSAAFLVSVIDGLPRSLGLIVLASLGTAFALQGYAVLHELTRGMQIRNALLAPLYFATFFFFPAPAVLAALFGLAHALTAARRHTPNPNP